MKLHKQILGKAFSVLAVGLLIQMSAHSDTTIAKKTGLASPKPAALVMPYRLILLLPRESYLSPLLPGIRPTLINPTRHLLALPWTGPDQVAFKVEYKASTANPATGIGWKQLMPNVKPHSDPNPQLQDPLPVTIDGSVQAISIDAENRFEIPVIYPDFPMTTNGFYRITAVVTVPQASEFNEPASMTTLVRRFTLAVYSKPFVIRHTATGFAPVDATTTKQASPK